VKERYAILLDEKEQAVGMKPSSMLDRVLFQKIETSSEGGFKELDDDYLQLIADKYEVKICLKSGD